MKTELKILLVPIATMAIVLACVVASPFVYGSMGFTQTDVGSVRGGGEWETVVKKDDCQKHNGFSSCTTVGDDCKECFYKTRHHYVGGEKAAEPKAGSILKIGSCGIIKNGKCEFDFTTVEYKCGTFTPTTTSCEGDERRSQPK